MSDSTWLQWYASFLESLSGQQRETLQASPALQWVIDAQRFDDAEKLINQMLFGVPPRSGTLSHQPLPEFYECDESISPKNAGTLAAEAGSD